MIYDTTVLVYAVGRDHRFRDPCRRLFVAAESGSVDARTTVEVIQEFVHVRSRVQGREDAVARARSFAALLGPLLGTDETNLQDGLALYGATSRIGSFDAVLAAVAIANGAVLVSADRAFGTVPGLEHVVPTPEAVAALVG